MADSTPASPSAPAPQTASATSESSAPKAAQPQTSAPTSNSELDTLFKKSPASSSSSEKPLTEAQKAEIRKFKVKISGAEREVTEEELIRDYQLKEASNQKFQEAAQKMKMVEEAIRLLKTDPRKVLSHPDIGVDVRKFAEQVLSEALEEELMDPKDKALREAQAARKAAEEALAKHEEEKRSAVEAEQVKHWEAEYTKQIDTALAAAKLPKNNGTINRCRDYMLLAIQNGYPDITAEQVMPYVKADFVEEVKSLFGANEASVIAELLGEESIKKLRTYDVSKIKKASGPEPKEQAPEKQERSHKAKPKTVDSYFAELNKRFPD